MRSRLGVTADAGRCSPAGRGQNDAADGPCAFDEFRRADAQRVRETMIEAP